MDKELAQLSFVEAGSADDLASQVIRAKWSRREDVPIKLDQSFLKAAVPAWVDFVMGEVAKRGAELAAWPENARLTLEVLMYPNPRDWCMRFVLSWPIEGEVKTFESRCGLSERPFKDCLVQTLDRVGRLLEIS